MRAEDIMTRTVVSIHQDASVQEAARVLVERGISGLPVVDDEGRVVGIVTEGDLLKRLRNLQLPTFIDLFGGIFALRSNRDIEAELAEMTARKVRELMTADVVTVRPDSDVQEIANLLISKRIKRVPVTEEDGTLVGIVSRTDVVKTLVSDEHKE